MSRVLGAGILFALTVACSSTEQRASNHAATQSLLQPERSTSAVDPRRPRIVVLGDSLTAGLGVAPEQAYPSLLQQRLDAEGLAYEIVNAGVSGDTSAGGLRRLDWALQGGEVAVLVVALGGNDGLRGLPAEELTANLSRIIEGGQASGADVILAGMEAPPNFGRAYIVDFHDVYPKLAKKYRVPLVPFLLEGVAGIAALNQPDGIHPSPEGARRVADNVWPVLKPVLASRASKARSEKVPGA